MITAEKEYKVIEMYRKMTPVITICKELGVTKSEIKKVVDSCPDIESCKPKAIRARHEARNLALKMLDDGTPPKEVAERLKVRLANVYYWRAARLKERGPVKSLSTRDEVMTMFMSGKRISEIESETGVSRATLNKYVNQIEGRLVGGRLILKNERKTILRTLTGKEKTEVAKYYRQGLSAKETALKLNLDIRSVKDVYATCNYQKAQLQRHPQPNLNSHV